MHFNAALSKAPDRASIPAPLRSFAGMCRRGSGLSARRSYGRAWLAPARIPLSPVGVPDRLTAPQR